MESERQKALDLLAPGGWSHRRVLGPGGRRLCLLWDPWGLRWGEGVTGRVVPGLLA